MSEISQTPTDSDDAAEREPRWWESELRRRHSAALRMGGPENVERQHIAARWTARERIEQLLDQGSFSEIGILTGTVSGVDDQGDAILRPANVVVGIGRIDERDVIIVAEDFTVRGGSSEATSPEKWQYAERLALEYRMPVVRLVETAGGSINLLAQAGGTKIPGYPHWPWMDLLGTVPVVGAALGACAGLGAHRIVATHFSVMTRETSQVFAGGPAVVRPGVGQDVGKDALGGAHVHARGSGVVDNEAIDEKDALASLRAFLSYLPSSVHEPPPVSDCADPTDRCEDFLADVIPENTRKPYVMRDVLSAVFDAGSLFEIGKYAGRSSIAMLARLNGHPVGVMANDPLFLGGALTSDSAEKQIRFVDMCDTFHLPVINVVDQPGTYVGTAAEEKGTVRRGVRAQLAIEQASTPWCSIFVRRAFGLAGASYAPLTHGINWRYAWPTAYWGSIPIEGGVEAAFRRDIAAAPDSEERRAELIAQFKPLENPFITAQRFGIQDIIDPRHTRPILCAWVGRAYRLVPSLLGTTGRYMRC